MKPGGIELKTLIQDGEASVDELNVSAPGATEMAARLSVSEDARHGFQSDSANGQARSRVDASEPEISTLEGKTRCVHGKAWRWASVSGSWDLLGEAWYPCRIAGFIGIAGDGVLEFQTLFEKSLDLFVVQQVDMSCYALTLFAPAISCVSLDKRGQMTLLEEPHACSVESQVAFVRCP